MKILQSSWQDGKGLKIHMQAWEPDARPKAVVGMLHGLGEHIARHAPVADGLVRAGFAAVGVDLRGHGRSEGRRGHTPNYEVLLDDVDALLARIAELHRRRPMFLYGHSLGGTLAISYALRRPSKLKGVIALAPWLREVVKAPPLKLTLARILNPVLPTYTDRWAADAEALSHDRSVGEAYERDPLVHNLITARMYLEVKAAGQWALDHAREFPAPVLLMHGTEDKFTSWEATQEFARRVGTRATWRKLDGLFHELQNEPERSRIVRSMVSWMNARLDGKAPVRRPAGQTRGGMGQSRPLTRKGD